MSRLLGAGADPGLTDAARRTAAEIALELGHLDIAATLRRAASG